MNVLICQITFDPLFDPQTSLILEIEANAEILTGRFGPTHGTTHPYAGQREKRK